MLPFLNTVMVLVVQEMSVGVAVWPGALLGPHKALKPSHVDGQVCLWTDCICSWASAAWPQLPSTRQTAAMPISGELSLVDADSWPALLQRQ